MLQALFEIVGKLLFEAVAEYAPGITFALLGAICGAVAYGWTGFFAGLATGVAIGLAIEWISPWH